MTQRAVAARPSPRLLLRPGPLRVATALAAAALADVAVDPVRRHIPLCPLHAATGWDCPLCGSLRAVDELAHGHVAAALRYNALLVLALPILLALWSVWLTRESTGRPAHERVGCQRRPVPRTVLIAAVALFTAFGVLRNLPWGHALRA